ncbi:LysE family transporter [Clostridium estertheticum]|uniref:LysE family transporter n=1 Tax=Clostridium estertheticum TaxID=238834 RepID=UPI0013E936FF|nr:LysE family transporter [Clostridium estertheticum]MBZ9686731.1 LysE family transporter [Clostridium estertheticum]
MNNLIPFLSYVFVATFTPGPNNILSMVNAKRYGFKNSFRFNLGILTGFIILMIACSYFNLFLFDLMPKIEHYVGIFGAAYMLYLAYKVTFGTKKTTELTNKETNTYIAGLTMQFVNPKVILYGITVISTFITPYYKSGFTLILFSLLLAFIGFVSTLCWALFGALFQNFLTKYNKQFNIVMGLLLVYCAVSISGLIG